MTFTYKDEHEMLPFALHGQYQEETPFLSIYNMEVVPPMEVKVPSMKSSPG